jgi:DNA-binding XRE family transcriptional regulator
MENYLDEFRMNVKYYREKLGISQTQLSIICDCGSGTIGGIESGKAKPSFDMMIKIAQALKVTPADLFIRNISKSKTELKQQLKQQFDSILCRL